MLCNEYMYDGLLPLPDAYCSFLRHTRLRRSGSCEICFRFWLGQ